MNTGEVLCAVVLVAYMTLFLLCLLCKTLPGFLEWCLGL